MSGTDTRGEGRDFGAHVMAMSFEAPAKRASADALTPASRAVRKGMSVGTTRCVLENSVAAAMQITPILRPLAPRPDRNPPARRARGLPPRRLRDPRPYLRSGGCLPLRGGAHLHPAGIRRSTTICICSALLGSTARCWCSRASTAPTTARGNQCAVAPSAGACAASPSSRPDISVDEVGALRRCRHPRRALQSGRPQGRAE